MTTTALVPAKIVSETPWSIELYDDVLPSQALMRADRDREAAEYRELGLTELAQHVGRHLSGHLMSQNELAVWAWRYPTMYRTPNWRAGLTRRQPKPGPTSPPTLTTAAIARVGGLTMVVCPWDQLIWPVPADVRRLIKEHEDDFTALEIWVPELRRAQWDTRSPILVGVGGEDRYLLARWAEALEPFEEIAGRARSAAGRKAQAIRHVYQHSQDMTAVGCAVLASAATTVALFFGGLGLFSGYPGATVFGFVLLPIAASAWRAAWRRTEHAVDWACRYAGWVRPETR